jgi:hypothetical protein
MFVLGRAFKSLFPWWIPLVFAYPLFACILAEPVMSRHRQKQFLTTVPKEPLGGKVGFFNPLTYPVGKDR